VIIVRRRTVLLPATLAAGLIALGLTVPTSAGAVPGQIVEFKVPTAAAGLNHLTTGPDGNIWFVETDANKIAKITTSGQVTEYKVPIASSMPIDITAGPDGAMWFTMSAVNMIGHVTTSGVFKTFTVPTANSAPWGITYNPADGLIWLTESGVGKIASLTTAGVFKEYTDFNGAADGPRAITAGPIGRVWYVTSNSRLNYHGGNGYGESSPAGITTAYAVTQGDDGALWVGHDSTVSRIAQFGATPTDYLQGYAIAGITAGSDRGVWFTMSNANNSGYVGRITTAGITTLYAQPPTGAATLAKFNPVGITSGPDGAMWFTDAGNNMIGRIPTGDVTAMPQPTVLVAYQAVVAKTKVTVNYALTGKAALSLVVKNSKGVSTTVASGAGKTGKGSLVWNRKIKNKAAPKGKYTVSVVATANGKSVKSSLPITLK
jgi:streptogramin lyase